MPKALFFSIPGHGHVTPSLPVVQELVRRGHEITYFVTEEYRTSVESAGATFHAYSDIGNDYFTSQGLSGSVPQRVAQAMITTSEQVLPQLLAHARDSQPDYVMFDSMCSWGRLTAQILKLPTVASLALAPLTTPPPATMLKLLPLVLPLILRDLDKGIDANRRANRLTKAYDLPPLNFVGILNNLGDISIHYTSREYQPFADTVHDSVRFVGWTPYEAPASAPFSYDRVQGRRLIYVSLGTLNNENAAFFRACIDAFAGGEDFVMMTTGKRLDPESFGALPENVAIYSWVPQVDILKRAALFISHGGLNSIHDSLYFGVPLLVVPQQAEQTLNAMRVVELEAGLMLKRGQVTSQAIRASAARLLTEPKFKANAQQMGETFRATGGVTRAADEIEHLLHMR